MNQLKRQAVISALKSLPALQLVPPLCAGGFEGKRTGSGTGGALEFSDYRFYREGDELKRIDWKLFARSEQLMVRRFSRDTDPRCDIIIDCSRSMDFYGKAAAAAGLAALFAQSAVNGGFSLQLWALHDEPRLVTPSDEPLSWQLPEIGSCGDIQKALGQLGGALFSNGLRIFISDLLYPLPPGQIIEVFRGGNCAVIQILGKEEIDPVFNENMTLSDPETGMCRDVSGGAEAAGRYKERLIRLQEQWAACVRIFNSSFFFFSASELLASWPVDDFFKAGILK